MTPNFNVRNPQCVTIQASVSGKNWFCGWEFHRFMNAAPKAAPTRAKIRLTSTPSPAQIKCHDAVIRTRYAVNLYMFTAQPQTMVYCLCKNMRSSSSRSPIPLLSIVSMHRSYRWYEEG